MPVERVHPDVDRIIPQGSDVEILGQGFAAEGPVWIREKGYLLLSDHKKHERLKWSPKEGVTFVTKTNRGNGQTRDQQGRLIVCEKGGVVVYDDVEFDKNGAKRFVAERVAGAPIFHTNDVVVKSDGWVYFTGTMTGREHDSGIAKKDDPVKYPVARPHTCTSLYYIEIKRDANGRPATGYDLYRAHLDGNGESEVVVGDLSHPNGLAFSPDEKTLYVDDTREVHIRAFDVEANGSLDLKSDRVFFEFNRPDRLGHPDGMKIDSEGNVYCTGPGGIWIINKSGRHLGTISIGEERHTNMAWGGDKLTTLFMTCHNGLARIELGIPGIPVPSRIPIGHNMG